MQAVFRIKESLKKTVKGKNAGRLLFVAGIAAILMIFLSYVSAEDEADVVQAEVFSEDEYRGELEAQVRKIVSALCGDNEAVVAVTLDTGVIYEYANEIKRNNAEDSSKISEESEKTYITVKDSSGGESPLIITKHLPQIRGVTVICAYSEKEMAESIKGAVTAALDINSKQIYIGRKS